LRDEDVAVRLLPDSPGVWVNRAVSQVGLRQWEQALADLRQADRLQPNNSTILRAMGDMLSRLGRIEEALATMDRSLALNGTDASAQNLACWLRAAFTGGDLNRARQHCDEAIRLAPDEATYRDSRGLVGLKQNRWADAFADYDQAVRLQPLAHHLFGRGIAALRLGRTVDGQGDLAAARRIDSGIDAEYARYSVQP